MVEADLWKVDYEVFEHFMLRLADSKKNTNLENSRISSKESDHSPGGSFRGSPIRRVSNIIRKKKKKKKLSKNISHDPSKTMSQVSLLTSGTSQEINKTVERRMTVIENRISNFEISKEGTIHMGEFDK